MPDLILDASSKPPVIRRVVNGKRIVEKIPRTAQDPRRPGARLRRWVRMLDSYGNDVFAVLTTAAAEAVPEGKYANTQRRKFRKHGWFPFGQCPIALLSTGQLRKSALLTQWKDGERPCDPNKCDGEHPCKHAVAEQVARQDVNRVNDAAQADAWKSGEMKMAEANHAAMQEQTKAITEALTNKLGSSDNTDLIQALPEMIAAAIAAAQKGGKR